MGGGGEAGVAKRENTCTDFYHYPQIGREGKQRELREKMDLAPITYLLVD